MDIMQLFAKKIKFEEGCDLVAYLDTAKPPKWTLAWGRCIDTKGFYSSESQKFFGLDTRKARVHCIELGKKDKPCITQAQADEMLRNDLRDVYQWVIRRVPFFNLLPDNAKLVLLDMSFQMGVEGMLDFTQTLAHLQRKEWKEASKDMLRSLYAQQTPERAKRNAELLNEIK